MTRFLVYLLAAGIAVSGGTVFAYRNPAQVPPALQPVLAKAVALAGLPPVDFTTVAAAPSRGGGGGGAASVAVEVAPVKIDAVSITIEAVGTLLSNESVTVAPEIAGRIAELHIDEGRPVKAGERLVVLDDAVLKAEQVSAAAALELAQANYERADTLVKQNAGTVRARDEAVANLESARAAADLAKAKLDKTVIRAPFAGILGLRSVSLGEYVTAGDALVTLQSIDPIKVDFRIPETYLANVAVGQKLTVTLDALPGREFEGEVYAIDPQVDVNGRALKLRARIPNPEGDLKPGLFARVRMVADSRENALIVPESALVPQGDQRFVYIVRDGKAVRVTVTLGHRLRGAVEVLDGLAAGDVVVTAGQQRLRDGATVEIVTPADARA